MSDTVSPSTFSQALLFWVKLGFISFGGPAGQIALMHQELVERRHWISERRFLHALNYCMLIPGPEAQQLATYLGWLMHRARGGIAAGSLFVLPSMLLLIGLSWAYVTFGQLPVVQAVLFGVKPAVVALVIAAVVRIARRTLNHPLLWAVAAIAFAALLFHTPFPLVIAGAALAGWAGRRWVPEAPSAPESYTAAQIAIIDDDTPTPPHAMISGPRLFWYAAVGLACWLAPMAVFTLLFGWTGTLTQMGWFFTQAALVTFGGAYAALPFFAQGVAHYGWLTPAQMIDGLALGETTPGPLVIIVTFIGYLGGGLPGALTATWFTFLPSFLFILLGGPFIEATKGSLHWRAPLTAITAAVVGVILSLALFFAQHVFWPEGWGKVELPSLTLAAAAALALIAFKRNAVEVIVACAVLGCVWKIWF